VPLGGGVAAPTGTGVAAAAFTAFRLRPLRSRGDPSPYPRFTAEPPEQPGAGLVDHLELGIVLIDTKLVEGDVLGFFHCLPGCLDPFHALSPLLLLRP